MNNKKNVLLICGILAVIFSLLFIVIRPVTGIFLISYIFALIGLAGLCWSVCYVIDHKKSYPWIAAIPAAVRSYLIIELIISAIFVLIEQLAKWSAGAMGFAGFVATLRFAPGWYLLIHAVLLLIFVIRIIMLKGGAEHIDTRGEQVKAQTAFIQSLCAEAALLPARASDPALKKSLAALAEKLRYSDPMSTEALAPLDAHLSAKFDGLQTALNDPDKAAALVHDLELLLEERNMKCRLGK